MKPFLRAVAHSLHYRWTIAGAFCCSLVIAVIWSASITTVFPIVKIVLEKETAKSWVQHEIENGERNILAVNREIVALEADFEKSSDIGIANKIDLKRERLQAKKSQFSGTKISSPTLTGTRRILLFEHFWSPLCGC